MRLLQRRFHGMSGGQNPLEADDQGLALTLPYNLPTNASSVDKFCSKKRRLRPP
jgi:hypothetical protein